MNPGVALAKSWAARSWALPANTMEDIAREGSGGRAVSASAP